MHYYFALLITQALFGLNFVVSKLIITQIPSEVYVFYRFLITTLLVWLFCPFFWGQRPKFTVKFLVSSFGFSILGYGGTQILIISGLSLTSPTNAAIITTLIPIFTLMIVVVSGQQKLTTKKFLGFLLAFIGVSLTLNWQGLTLNWNSFQGDLLVFLGALSAAFFLVYSKEFYKISTPYWSAAWLFLWATIITSPALFFSAWPQNFVWSHSFLAAFSYAVVGATLVAYMLVNWLIPLVGAEKVSLFAYLQPIFASFGAMLFLGHSFEKKHFAATFFIFIGFMLAIRESNKQSKS